MGKPQPAAKPRDTPHGGYALLTPGVCHGGPSARLAAFVTCSRLWSALPGLAPCWVWLVPVRTTCHFASGSDSLRCLFARASSGPPSTTVAHEQVGGQSHGMDTATHASGDESALLRRLRKARLYADEDIKADVVKALRDRV